ncbi:MAG: hypothetical protein P0Y49_04640 [Candidatus Pedobacter colombiensis]|uniref:Alpha/beta hydrolase n=1 Tax=Candidatus Pedobacter colombiensis TaxID=3121371 RepID=A0AAJ5WB90_9SPHI|nr:hypothetical protein [Pedobacter sp.]WEK20425.1 MAG: hypothetical protein P0Y49_04640 [Pedobacter sp.]
MNLILIHGRDQQGQDPSMLKKLWIDTLKKGFGLADLQIPENVNVVFPFYGDLLDGLIKEVTDPTELAGVIAKGDIPEKELIYFYEFITELADNAGLTLEDINVNYHEDHREKGALNWAWVQAILQTLDSCDRIGKFTLQKFTYDVFIYLTNAAIKRRINDFILTAFDDEPCVVVGHSLGSVVGYNVLQANSNLKVNKYITIGSPLGVKAVKSRLTTPLSMPLCVKNGWYNAYDERDYVALNSLDKHNFNIEPSILNSNHVKNATNNRHGIEGYLNDAKVAKAIYDAMVD